MTASGRPTLRVLSAGPDVTIQDGGRHGYLRYGVTGAGPMDRLAHATANRAVDNAATVAAIEVSLGGIEVTVDDGAIAVAVAGGEFAITLNGQALPLAVTTLVEPGAKLRLRAGNSGSWCYLAVVGGFDLPPVLGSVSTHTRTAIGGLDGRALLAGDRLAIDSAQAREAGETGLVVAPLLDRPADTVRVILGPQADYFAKDQIESFLAGLWKISARGDRMATATPSTPAGPARSKCCPRPSPT